MEQSVIRDALGRPVSSQLMISGMHEYRYVLEHVLSNGTPRSPRGQKTLDAGQTTVVLTDPSQGLAVGVGRGLSPRVAAVEALQLMGNFHDPDMMRWASPQMGLYAEDDGHFHGAYGLRIGSQAWFAMRKLQRDHDTRQAVMTLWDGNLDNKPGYRDYPCTVGMGFTRRGDSLDLHVTMRSNDAYLGFPYDVFQFTQLQLTMARLLGVRAGVYVHTAWSLHVYEENFDKATACLTADREVISTYQPEGIGKDGGDWDEMVSTARLLGRKNTLTRLTTSEEWYRDVLAGYVAAR